MHCKNCGAQYKTRELMCPYCGTENMIGRIWMVQRSEAEKEYEEARIAAGKGLSVYVLNRVLTRILVILSVASALLLLGILLYGTIKPSIERDAAAAGDSVTSEADDLRTETERFENCRLGFLTTPEEEKTRDDYYFQYGIKIGIRLLEWEARSGAVASENKADYDAVCNDVTAYFIGVLGMTPDELDSILTTDFLPSADENALIDALWERGAWQ